MDLPGKGKLQRLLLQDAGNVADADADPAPSAKQFYQGRKFLKFHFFSFLLQKSILCTIFCVLFSGKISFNVLQ